MAGDGADDRKNANLKDYLLALATGGLVVVSALQWWEIRAGSIDTHALAEASKQQAEALANNTKITYQSLIASSRPWISLTSPVMKYPKMGEGIQVYQEFGNVGHSPAVVANGWFGRFYDNGEYNRDFPDDVRKARNDCLSRTIENSNDIGARFPGTDRSYYYYYDSIKYQNQAIVADEDFMSGRTIFVFHACYSYRVGSDIKHTYLCSLYQMPKSKIVADEEKSSGIDVAKIPKDATQDNLAKTTSDNSKDVDLHDCQEGSYAD